MAKPTNTEVLAILKSIERGDITLTSESQPQDVYAGNVEYSASNGWRLIVFNDCNCWDYLDSAINPNGEILDFGEMDEKLSFGYRPSGKVAWSAYGIPGYLKHRKVLWKGAPRPRRGAVG